MSLPRAPLAVPSDIIDDSDETQPTPQRLRGRTRLETARMLQAPLATLTDLSDDRDKTHPSPEVCRGRTRLGSLRMRSLAGRKMTEHEMQLEHLISINPPLVAEPVFGSESMRAWNAVVKKVRQRIATATREHEAKLNDPNGQSRRERKENEKTLRNLVHNECRIMWADDQVQTIQRSGVPNKTMEEKARKVLRLLEHAELTQRIPERDRSIRAGVRSFFRRCLS